MQSLGVGFSFAGKHCDDMQCELGNNDESMHSFMENFTVVSENLEGYDGAYYVGETVKEKDFNIKLFVEEVADDVLARIGHWMRRGAHGKLIFDHAPYKYYNVQVSAPMDVSGLYTKFNLSRQMFVYSGVIGVKLTAYTPYAYLLDEVKSAYPNVGDMLNTLNASSAIMAESERPVNYLTGNEGTILAANLGNAVAKPNILLAGKFPTGTTIKNVTTGQEMTIKNDEPEEHTYIISASTGLTEHFVDAQTREAADTIKTGSFITLLPAFPAPEIKYEIVDGVLMSQQATEDMVGKYVFINGEWLKIIAVDGFAITLEKAVASVMVALADNGVALCGESICGETICGVASSNTNKSVAKVIQMNEIKVKAGVGDTVSRVTLEYRDTFY